jgi:methyl-accepting chemotaxis protein
LLGVTIAAALFLLRTQEFMMTVIERIVGRLDHIAQGDLTDVIPLHRVDELGKLNDGLVSMQNPVQGNAGRNRRIRHPPSAKVRAISPRKCDRPRR